MNIRGTLAYQTGQKGVASPGTEVLPWNETKWNLW